MTKKLTKKEKKYREELVMFRKIAEEQVTMWRVHLDDAYYTPEEVKAAAIKIQEEQAEITDTNRAMASSIEEFGE